MSPAAPVAVVTIAHGRHDHLKRQRRALASGPVRPLPHVIVALADDGLSRLHMADPWTHVVPMAADPAALPLAAARNVGAQTALALGADVLVFLDVDCIPGDGLLSAYGRAARDRTDVVWSGPVTYLPPAADYDLTRLAELDNPHPARPAPAIGVRELGADPDLFWSLSFAVHADGWRDTGGFCEEYVGYGAEDTDFAQQALASGLQLGWLGAARAYHQHHPTRSPPTQHLDDIIRNGRLFNERWGRWPMQGWLRAFEEQGLAAKRDEGWVVARPD